MGSKPYFIILLCAATILLASCGEDMADQPRVDWFGRAEGASGMHRDRPVDGAVPTHSELTPTRPPLTLDLLHDGMERFNIYCAPCHARDGLGDGMIVRRGYPPPPSLHEPRLMSAADEHMYEVVTHGLGKMPAYGGTLRHEERWAIVEYVRALQLSRSAQIADLPESDMRELLRSEAGR